MYKNLMFPTDGSENSKNALKTAIDLTKKFDAKLTVVHVVDGSSFIFYTQGLALPNIFEQLEEEGKQIINDTIDEGKKNDITVESKILEGHPAEEIIKESKNYDLIIMGSLGRTGISKMLLGSVAEKVVRFAECPVLVVRIKQS